MRDRLVLFLIGIAVAVIMLGWMIVNPFFPPMTATPAARATALAQLSATPVPPSSTLAPPTATRAPATPTPLPPTATVAPLSAEAIWQRAAACACPTVYTLPETGSAIVLKALSEATKSIRLKMYLFTSTEIQNALIEAARRGVDVRVLMELNPYGGQATNVEIFNAMKGTPIRFRWTSFDFRFTHEKSLVIDDRVAFIMSHNFTVSSFTSNREYGVVDSRPEDVAEIIKVYEADWEKVPVDLKDARLVWSPVNARQKWIALIDSARVSLDLEQAEWLSGEIVKHVLDAAGRGVKVRGLFSPGDPIESDPAEPNRELLRQAGAQVKYLSDPYVHAKMFLVDGQRVFIGSENVSDNSLDNNRELGIILDRPDAIQTVQQAFEKDWAVGTLEPFPVSDIPIPANGIVRWQDAKQFYNREVTIEGKVVKIYNSGKVMFLQFSESPETDVKAVIFPQDWGKFTDRPDRLFFGQVIRVTGRVVKYQGAPEIIVNNSSQIQLAPP